VSNDSDTGWGKLQRDLIVAPAKIACTPKRITLTQKDGKPQEVVEACVLESDKGIAKLSDAIIETINAGARIINLSLGLSTSAMVVYDRLQQAYDYAVRKGVIIVVAAGNQGNIGNTPIISHQWLIPVTGNTPIISHQWLIPVTTENGRLGAMSNFGPSIGSRGLMAPRVNVNSTYPEGRYTRLSGTSIAAPFVTGGIALLWSLFTNYTAAPIIYSTINAASSKRRSILPPLFNAEAAWKLLKNVIK
jgi:subtilisin family serine protease